MTQGLHVDSESLCASLRGMPPTLDRQDREKRSGSLVTAGSGIVALASPAPITRTDEPLGVIGIAVPQPVVSPAGAHATVVLRAPTLASSSGGLISNDTKLVQARAVPARLAPEWKAVTLIGSVESHTPFAQCNHCGVQFCATATRIKNHLLGLLGSKACTGSSEAFFLCKEQLMPAALGAAANKKAKLIESQVFISIINPTPMMLSQISRVPYAPPPIPHADERCF